MKAGTLRWIGTIAYGIAGAVSLFVAAVAGGAAVTGGVMWG